MKSTPVEPVAGQARDPFTVSMATLGELLYGDLRDFEIMRARIEARLERQQR